MDDDDEEWYTVLGVDPDCPVGVIKKAYQNLVIAHHPDKNKGVESASFIRILRAWKVLGDEESRRKYDAERMLAGYGSAVTWKSVSLDDMTEIASGLELECRCGGAYVLPNRRNR